MDHPVLRVVVADKGVKLKIVRTSCESGPLGSILAAAVAVAPAGIIFIPAGASLSWMVVDCGFEDDEAAGVI